MGSQSFMPSGAIATMAHAANLRRNGSARGVRRRRRKKTSVKTRGAKRAKRASGGSSRKPRPGTKAWMSYIRGMRKKKRK